MVAAIGRSETKPSIPRGPNPAVSRSGARTGGKPPSIVSRSASKESTNGLAKACQRSPSPGLLASRLAAVRSRSRYSATALPSGSGWARQTGGWTQRRPWRSSSERHEHRRGGARRVHGGEGVVVEPGKRELLRRDRAAGARSGLQHEHAPARLGESDGRRQAVGTRPDDERVVAHGAKHRGRLETGRRGPAPGGRAAPRAAPAPSPPRRAPHSASVL